MFPLRLLLLSTLLFCTLAPAQAQTPSPVDIEIKNLLIAKKYQEVIAFADRTNGLSDSSLYRIGRAYYHEDDTTNARLFFDRALAKNPRYQNAWYFRGILNYYAGADLAALSDMAKAIAIDSSDADFFSMQGKIYQNMGKWDEAIASFRQAIQRKDVRPDTWMLIGESYSEQKKYAQAAAAYSDALPHVGADPDMKARCLYNLGTMEYLSENWDKAEKAFAEMLVTDAEDYQVVAKMVQVHYAQGKYKKAKPFKKTLYDAWKAEKLPKHMAEDFCFDQFEWNGKRVMAFEEFDEEGDLFYKHVFYVLDPKTDKIEFQVQTESSFAVAMTGKKYTLGMTKGKTHYTFMHLLFEDDPDYQDVKKAVLRIFDGKEKPSSSSTVTRN